MKTNSAILSGVLALSFALLPASLRASTILSYTNAPISFSITLETTLMGAALENLPAGTDIAGSIASSTITAPHIPPPTDVAGFPIGGGIGTGYLVITLTTAQIGTNGLGNITSWNLGWSLFASYPAFPGEDPNDFFCRYAVSSSLLGDQTSLVEDHDAGLCSPGAPLSSPGLWTSQAPQVPEPSTVILLSSGLLGLVVAARRRKNR